MPLHDHFRRPVWTRAPWTSVCHQWISHMMRRLNADLPADRYQSLATSFLGNEAEADISEFRLLSPSGPPPAADDGGGVAVLTAPPVVASFETALPDEFAVRVHDVRDDMRLVGAVEFVSPGNKDRPEKRARFVAKCLGYLSEGIGLVVIDIVTNRAANLHNELLGLLDGPPAGRLPDTPTYVAGYRSAPQFDRFRLDLWPYPVAVGGPLPKVPLVLKNGPCVLLDLEGTYLEAAADHRL